MTAGRQRALAVVLALMPALVSCGSSDAGVSQPGGGGAGRELAADGSRDDLAIRFASDPDPLRAGANDLRITITSSGGAPVTDATVNLVFSMPAMPAMNMPAMRSDATLRHDREGIYRGTARLSMGGTWNVALNATRGDEEIARRRFSLVASK